jgi:hypothetical protein
VIEVSPAAPIDAVAVAELLAETDRFYGDTTSDPPDVRVRQVSQALFAMTPME